MYHQGLKEFYSVVVKSELLYGAECYSIQITQYQNMKIAKMRVFRWMCRHARPYDIMNELIQD
ncbi:hypothetical protein H5410_039178 [Solanum commersonii]|uniref:Uncharacterized protein n=1 Tax=Solanum commersonii TaxID=4109 RepID=A0A9J5YCN1_SOLCO|nr:hypothetical protein H5410_039178 [Solanum commersonii]